MIAYRARPSERRATKRSPSDRPCQQASLMCPETFDDILTDNRVTTWDTSRAKELVARHAVMEKDFNRYGFS